MKTLKNSIIALTGLTGLLITSCQDNQVKEELADSSFTSSKGIH